MKAIYTWMCRPFLGLLVATLLIAALTLERISSHKRGTGCFASLSVTNGKTVSHSMCVAVFLTQCS